MVDIEEIERLIALMKATGVTELSVESGDFKVSLRRADEQETLPAAQSRPAVPAHVEEDSEYEHAPAATNEINQVFSTPVISPLVGIFHNGGMPERRSLLREGDKVEEGQVLAAIEAMKVPNELRAPVSGIIGKILVEDGVGVEFGQTLFLIEPEESLSGAVQ